MTIKPNRTNCYKFTVDMSSESDMKILKEFRKQYHGTPEYVKCQGRWGKNNPNYKRSYNFLGHSHRSVQFHSLHIATFMFIGDN